MRRDYVFTLCGMQSTPKTVGFLDCLAHSYDRSISTMRRNTRAA